MGTWEAGHRGEGSGHAGRNGGDLPIKAPFCVPCQLSIRRPVISVLTKPLERNYNPHFTDKKTSGQAACPWPQPMTLEWGGYGLTLPRLTTDNWVLTPGLREGPFPNHGREKERQGPLPLAATAATLTGRWYWCPFFQQEN